MLIDLGLVIRLTGPDYSMAFQMVASTKFADSFQNMKLLRGYIFLCVVCATYYHWVGLAILRPGFGLTFNCIYFRRVTLRVVALYQMPVYLTIRYFMSTQTDTSLGVVRHHVNNVVVRRK